ncbi:MAG: hypothetical protein LBR38_04420 [Synergistaceae bacterium]|jgi:hypothetical protein|nr:hypothetical protein [Synergistaceae bacterium]
MTRDEGRGTRDEGRGTSSALAPIAFFVYRRPDHAKRTLSALAANDGARQSDLFIFSDGPKDAHTSDHPSAADAEGVKAVREYVRSLDKSLFRSVTVIERETNLGLAKSLISGITELCSRFGRAVIVEDDILTSPRFLRFINDGLDRYEGDERVFSVTGFWPLKPRPGDGAFFLRGSGIWGWGTWKRAWDHYDHGAAGWEALLRNKRLAWEFDYNGRCNNTAMLLRHIGDKGAWGPQWNWIAFRENGLTLFPPYSLDTNVGFGDDATHTPKGGDWWAANIDLTLDRPIKMPERVEPDAEQRERYANFVYPSFRDRWKNCGFTPREIVKAVFWFLYRPLRFIEMLLPFGTYILKR